PGPAPEPEPAPLVERREPARPAAPSPEPAPGAPHEPPAGALTETAAKDLALEVMGSLSGANLYQSYVAIGLLADGVEYEALTLEGARNTLKVVTGCLALVDGKL